MDDMSLWENMGVGFVSSGIASFVTTPMDVVKTRMMEQHQGQHLYKSSIDCLIKVSARGRS